MTTPNIQRKMAFHQQIKRISNIQTKMVEEARSQASFESKKMAEVIHGRHVTLPHSKPYSPLLVLIDSQLVAKKALNYIMLHSNE